MLLEVPVGVCSDFLVRVLPEVNVGAPLDVPEAVYPKNPLGISQEAPSERFVEVFPKVLRFFMEDSL